MIKTISQYIIAIAILVAVFYFGRCTKDVKIEYETKYIKGDTIKGDSIPYPVPIYIDSIRYVPHIKDSIIKDTLYQSVDTLGIVHDYIKLFQYNNITLFNNDTIGHLSVNLDIQYNRLQKMSYNYIPIHKEVIAEKMRILQPFATIGVNSLYYPSLNIGSIYKNKYIFSYDLEYNHNFNKCIHGINIGIMF